ncbi:MAG: phage tail sheath family protein [Flavobacteriales bacterium]
MAMKTPGVYIIEKDAFPNSVVEVATAVPAFIGYTAKADNGGKSLLNKPFRISSFSEYLQYFGGAPAYKFSLTVAGGDQPEGDAPAAAPAGHDTITIAGTDYKLERESIEFRLYDAMKFFFQNGGGPCYIVSVGAYSKDGIKKDQLTAALPVLEKEMEPTMVLVPDALSLSQRGDCYSVYTAVLAHCNKMQSRIGVFDVYNGYKDRRDPSEVGDDNSPVDLITEFRTGIGTNFLSYGAAYYPWINTNITQDTDVSFQNLTDDSLTTLQTMILAEQKVSETAPEDPKTETTRESNIRSYVTLLPFYTEKQVKIKTDDPKSDDKVSPDDLNKTLVVLSPAYNALLKEIQAKLNLLPPASAMAGIYTMVDNTRGVWKAPANVSVSSTISPAVNITFEDQEDLNMPLNGKAVNAIRSFVGLGNMVWGARTLDGNSGDWRYINVRRTMIMLEQSVKAAAQAYVFEPNDANTWTTVKSMIENFLYQQWKKGALVGSKSTDAYAVLVGLGNTMTGDDILNGIMRITVLVAVSRPAEFIEITFQQQMQKS